MKYLLLLLIPIIFSCNNEHEKKETQGQKTIKVIKNKTSAIETDQEHHFDIWSGEMKMRPNTHTSYYLVYTDGSYEKVDVGRYSTSEIGDTIIKYEFITY